MKHILITIAALLLVGCGVPSPDDIYAAAYYGNTATVKQHIAAGADINAKNGGGFTPLHGAVGGPNPNWKGSKDIVELLIVNGADVNAKEKSNGWTPLHNSVIGRREYGKKEIEDLN